jgi:hypothetical protein
MFELVSEYAVQTYEPNVHVWRLCSFVRTHLHLFQELSSAPHITYCSITTWRKVHSRSIRRAAYTRDGEILLTCSHDSIVSVRSRHVPGKLDDYVFKVQRVSTIHHQLINRDTYC